MKTLSSNLSLEVLKIRGLDMNVLRMVVHVSIVYQLNILVVGKN